MSTIPQSGRYCWGKRSATANESTARKLEKIPEPMQLSLLDFIRSLGSK